MSQTLIHISDLHFGTEDPKLTNLLLSDIDHYQPHLVIISGDFTQRARKKQFDRAVKFLKCIQYPKIVIPGNHDVAIFNIFQRLFHPLRRFKKYISNDPYPYFQNDKIAVLGINSTNPQTWKDGHITPQQIAYIKDKFQNLNDDRIKILVAHHNLLPTPDLKRKSSIKDLPAFIKSLHEYPVDLILSGHLHQTYCANLKDFYPLKKSTFVVQAGTAISKRKRGEANSYNLITVHEKQINITVRAFNEDKFINSNKYIFKKDKAEWMLDSNS